VRTTILAGILLALPLVVFPATVTVTVADSSSKARIPEASVQIFRDGFDQEFRTGLDGSFRAELPDGSSYVLSATADGYQPGKDLLVTVEAGSPPLNFTLPMSRGAAVTGRLVDRDTGGPLASIEVAPRLVKYLRGERLMYPCCEPAKSNSEGTFLLKNLPPGEYVFEVNSSEPGSLVQRSRRPVYPRAFLPGSGEPEGILPRTVVSGETLDLGGLELSKFVLASLSVTPTGGTCSAGQAYDVDLNEMQPGRPEPFPRLTMSTRRTAPCKGSAIWNGVNPGRYLVSVSAAWQPESQRELGATWVEVGDRDATVLITLNPPLNVHGKIVLESRETDPKRVAADLAQWSRDTEILLAPHDVASLPRAKLSSDGAFIAQTYVPPDHKVGVFFEGPPSGLKGFYLKELHYNGSISRGRDFVIDPSAADHNLEIVFSDRLGYLTGTVRAREGKPIADVHVLIAPWPAAVESSYPREVWDQDADPSGLYSFVALHPGKYRVIAVPNESAAKLQEPWILMRLFESARDLEVAEATTTSADITVVIPPN
jgi:hypothetical protein